MLLKIYPDAPNYTDIDKIVQILDRGGIIIYPTTTGYAYACHALQTKAIDRICEIKNINLKKNSLSIMFDGMSAVSEYCKMNDAAFKFIKAHEGNYTFILPAASTLPKVLKNRKEVGVRLAHHPIASLIIQELGVPIITSSLPYDTETPEYSSDPSLVFERYGKEVDMVVDGDIAPVAPSTVIDCTVEPFNIIRVGSGRIEGIFSTVKED